MTVDSVMTADPTGKELVEFARRTAERLVKNDLTRTQIRNIFTEVRQIEARWSSEDHTEALRRLNMLKPKLDYQVARKPTVEHLGTVLSQAIDTINQAANNEERNERFRRFTDLFEAILAYHRALGGKN